MTDSNRNELMKTFMNCARTMHEIAEVLGVSNPLDKSKWREIIASYNGGYLVHTKASAGFESENYGSDCLDPCNNSRIEQKSVTITPKQEKDLLEGTLNKKLPMVYNGAYKLEAIEKYKTIRHHLVLFNTKGEHIMTIEVEPEYVISCLEKNLENKKNKKDSTTNCNTVKILFDKSIPQNAKVIWQKENNE